MVDRYQGRIGGPLMDRIDIVIDVARVDPSLLLTSNMSVPCSAGLREQVMEGRFMASQRQSGHASVLSGAELLGACDLSATARDLLERSARTNHLSGRGVTRLLRVARTCADLGGSARVTEEHLGEALGYRAREAG
jgi:magnesium chelatase family protein